jgi:hypothetical protein
MRIPALPNIAIPEIDQTNFIVDLQAPILALLFIAALIGGLVIGFGLAWLSHRVLR